MRILKTKPFRKFAHKARRSDAKLIEAVDRAERGLIDADLGGEVIKQRIARPGQGKSSGYRVVIFFRSETRAIFSFGFTKSDLANISQAQETLLKESAKVLLGLSDEFLDSQIKLGEFWEVLKID